MFDFEKLVSAVGELDEETMVEILAFKFWLLT